MPVSARLRLALLAAGALLTAACDPPTTMNGPQPASSNEAKALADAEAMLELRPPPEAAASQAPEKGAEN